MTMIIIITKIINNHHSHHRQSNNNSAIYNKYVKYSSKATQMHGTNASQNNLRSANLHSICNVVLLCYICGSK